MNNGYNPQTGFYEYNSKNRHCSNLSKEEYNYYIMSDKFEQWDSPSGSVKEKLIRLCDNDTDFIDLYYCEISDEDMPMLEAADEILIIDIDLTTSKTIQETICRIKEKAFMDDELFVKLLKQIDCDPTQIYMNEGNSFCIYSTDNIRDNRILNIHNGITSLYIIDNVDYDVNIKTDEQRKQMSQEHGVQLITNRINEFLISYERQQIANTIQVESKVKQIEKKGFKI